MVLLKLLDQINKANDIKNINPDEYKQLSDEIRRFLVDRISKSGGHLASNLGVVEITMAMHLCLDLPKDKIVWDVGHQAYTHKILTGRKDDFVTLRMYEGLSGFPKRSESDCDTFDTGHSSTSISVALGLAKARDIKGEDNKIFAVIGDGALSGGMAYEALNNAARIKSNLVIVLNDNNMSISENVGGMSNYLGHIRTSQNYIGLKDGIETTLKKFPKLGNSIYDKLKRSKDSLKRFFIPGMLFEDMGVTYIGPIDGHNIAQLTTAFQNAKKMKKAVLVHVISKKGKGYRLAENDPSKFHAMDPFEIKTGDSKVKKCGQTYTEVFAHTLLDIATKNDRIVAVTAAMTCGTGLTKFQEEYPNRFFDVGIAEEHAVTFSAGLAAGGLKPFIAIYSTFLQRAYDQILHDVCIGNYPVVFAIDRAGIVGRDGETHQGIFDLSFLMSIPNLAIVAPKNKTEFIAMLEFCADYNGPIAIRYPRGSICEEFNDFQAPITYSKSELLFKEKDIVLIAVGSMVSTANQVRLDLKEKGYSVSLVNARFVKPLDKMVLSELVHSHHTIVTLEENVNTGGFGQAVGSFLHENGYQNTKLINISIPDGYVEHGEVDILKDKLGLTKEAIVQKIEAEME